MRWFAVLRQRLAEEWDRLSGRRGARRQRELEATTAEFRRELERVFERMQVVDPAGSGTTDARRQEP